MNKKTDDILLSIKEIPHQIVPSAKLVFSSFAVIIKFCIGFICASFVLYIGLFIGLLKSVIPDVFSIADEINGGSGLLHLISTIIGWVVMGIPVAIAAFIAFCIMGITGPKDEIRRAARYLFATIISAFILIPMLFGGGDDEFGLSDAIVVTLIIWGTCIVVNNTVYDEEKGKISKS